MRQSCKLGLGGVPTSRGSIDKSRPWDDDHRPMGGSRWKSLRTTGRLAVCSWMNFMHGDLWISAGVETDRETPHGDGSIQTYIYIHTYIYIIIYKLIIYIYISCT